MTAVHSNYDLSWLYIHCRDEDDDTTRYFVQRPIRGATGQPITYIDADSSEFASGIEIAGWDLTW